MNKNPTRLKMRKHGPIGSNHNETTLKVHKALHSNHNEMVLKVQINTCFNKSCEDSDPSGSSRETSLRRVWKRTIHVYTSRTRY